jgi:UDP-N-acetylmuramate--alanine ligase
MKKYFLIGIGGSGMSAIARLLLESGSQVAGSDQTASPVTRSLEKQGVQIHIGHRAEQVAGADVVIQSSAIPESNPEIVEARRLGIPVQKRSVFLNDFLKERKVIAVAGTAGKTTTTAMLAWVLTSLGLDPGYLIGGVSKNLGNNSHYGKSEYFIVEADEYDRMFLGLQPELALILNTEHDHPDMFPTPAEYYDAFNAFIGQVKPDGILLAGENSADRLSAFTQVPHRYTFGLSRICDYELRATSQLPDGATNVNFVKRTGKSPAVNLSGVLNVPGEHNALNALAAFAAVDLLTGCPAQVIMQWLEAFNGTERRFEKAGSVNGILFIDDYAHHPAKIRSTLQAARSSFRNRRIWAVWQPHTYSRTRTFFAEFAASFEGADQVLITEVYAAREENDGFSAAQFLPHLPKGNGVFAATLQQAEDYLFEHLQPGDVMIMLSAGDANQIIPHLMERIGAAKEVTA